MTNFNKFMYNKNISLKRGDLFKRVRDVEALLNKAPGSSSLLLYKGGESMYMSFADTLQLLSLLCEVLTVFILVLNLFKNNKK